MAKSVPAVFVSHGAPTTLLEPGPTHEFLRRLGLQLGKPRAVVCASAHWESRQPLAGAASRPATIHDFAGFSGELAAFSYAAPGAPEIAATAVDLLRRAGFAAETDEDRGIDHGVWVPLGLMYPGADVPVVEISVQPQAGSRHHLEVGRALTPLRSEGVLVLGSGGATHNLRDYFGAASEAAAPAYVAEFEEWLCTNVASGAEETLVDYLAQAPSARRNHPTPEHLLPFFVALGAAAGGRGRVLHRGSDHGVLSLLAFAWD